MAELAGLPRAHALERAHEAFFYVGLGEVRYRALGTYSLGMKQAAKLAQAIAHGPKLLFLDEPTNGLDPPARVRMIQLIQEIRDRGDLHLILSSHLLRDVEECCDEVLILKDGKVAAFCNLEEERRANRRFLEIETRGETNGLFLEAVEKLGCETAPGAQGRVKLIMPDGLEVRRLYQVAAEQNVQIRRLSHKRDSLEDIFLKAMETANGRL
jgi:ABC-2 type transport system ATP-binding protein